MRGFTISEGAGRKLAEVSRRVLGTGQDISAGTPSTFGGGHAEIEGILQDDLGAASDSITGSTTAEMKVIRCDPSSDDGVKLTEEKVTVTNRSKSFSAMKDGHVRATWINGEWRPAGGGCTSMNAIWSIIFFGPPTAGTFTLTYKGQTTTSLQYSATAQQIETALVNLSNIGLDDNGNKNISVTGSTNSWHVEFQNDLGKQEITGFTVNGTGLTAAYFLAAGTFLIQQGRK